MKRLLIIENEFHSIKAPINVLESLYRIAQEELVYDICVKSQDIKWTELAFYHAILVDLSLAAKSEMDGYAILNKIKTEYPNLVSRTAIITGNGVIENALKERGINHDEFKVFTKPLKYMMLKQFIDNVAIAES